MALAPANSGENRFARPDSTQSAKAAEPQGRILVVDDDATTRVALEKLLSGAGFAVSMASDAEAAVAEANGALPDVVLTDLHMPRIHGADLCRRLHAIDIDLPVIVMTASSEMEAVVESLRAGAEDYLVKPLHCDALLWSVERALERRTAKREQAALYRALNERLVMSSVREQEHAEAEARQRAELNALLANLGEGVTIADRSGHIVLMNAVARATLGVGDRSLETIDALHVLEAYDLDGQPLAAGERPIMRALQGEQFSDYEVLRMGPCGESRRIVSTGTNVRDDRGEVALAIVVSRDVTELRRLEQQRDEYLALITHDLRSPLSAISLFVSTLKHMVEKRALSAEAALAARTEQSLKRMGTMLDELTEATIIESQGVAPRADACDLGVLVADIVRGMDDASAQRISVETEGPRPYVVFADSPRLGRVVANLLTNALKYSAEDSPVKVRLGRKGNDVELVVIDRGIGIEPTSAKMLFDRYYRTKAGKARAGGLGLGLYIARLVVEAHGGRIDVSSEVGRGSTFTVLLPLREPDRVSPPK